MTASSDGRDEEGSMWHGISSSSYLVKMTSDTVLIANGCWKVNGGGSAGQHLAGGRRHRIIYKDNRL